MANICENRIKISLPEGQEKLAKQIVSAAQKNQLLEFIAPIKAEFDNISGQAEAQRSEWGTRCDMGVLDICRNGTCVEIDADSAWAPPLGALETFMENNPGCEITCEYCEPSEFVGFWESGIDNRFDMPESSADLEAEIPAELIAKFGLADLMAENEATSSSSPGI
jgi:hypothetical protein